MNTIIFGMHAIQVLLQKDPQRFQKVFILKGRNDSRLQSLVKILKFQGIIIQLVDRQWLDTQVQHSVHQGIIARVKSNKNYQEDYLYALLETLEKPFLLILDCITDPYNLGACLRSANAAGVHAVIVPKNRSSSLNATVIKVSCGAAENIPLIRVINLSRTIRLLQEKFNIWIVGTAENANHTIYQTKLPDSLALVMGSEGEGMRYLTRKNCDEIIKIPTAIDSISSLNVSVATGICLFEVVRQRSFI